MTSSIRSGRQQYHGSERKVIHGKRLTIKQSQQFDYFMENSETFRNRFFELSTQVESE